MAVDIPLVNGIQNHWAQITMSMLGAAKVYGVTKITYKDEQDMENNYGAGNFPYGRGFGKITPTASITLYMDEVESLQASAPQGRLQNYPEFDITVSFVPALGKAPSRHVIKNCRFKNNGRDVSTGDMKLEVELELLPSHIEWGVAL